MKKDEMQPKRILCIVGSMNVGGAETFLMKVYRSLDKRKYQMDFYVSTQVEGFYDKEIISMGGKIFRSLPKTKNPIKSLETLRKTVKREKYKYVMRVSQHSLSTLDLLAAKFGGAKTLIYRSSNSGTGGGRINQFMHILFKWLSISVPNIKIAPSTEAAEFMFGKNCIRDGKATIIKNAIPIEKFTYSKQKRDKIRKEFNLNNELVIGHVGRFNFQKNHAFLIDIFNEIVKKHERSVLILVGKGELEEEVKNKIDMLGLTNKVIFTGVRSDVPDIMMAMDVFVFPSFFEGMPNTIIEAQATGLPCIISDKITKEAQITRMIEFVSLEKNEKVWADKVLKYVSEDLRNNTKKWLAMSGYDIKSVTSEIERLIFLR